MAFQMIFIRYLFCFSFYTIIIIIKDGQKCYFDVHNKDFDEMLFVVQWLSNCCEMHYVEAHAHMNEIPSVSTFSPITIIYYINKRFQFFFPLLSFFLSANDCICRMNGWAKVGRDWVKMKYIKRQCRSVKHWPLPEMNSCCCNSGDGAGTMHKLCEIFSLLNVRIASLSFFFLLFISFVFLVEENDVSNFFVALLLNFAL